MKSVLMPVYSSLDVASMTGVSLRQLQWWDEQGVVTPVQKGRRRLYSAAEVLAVSLIMGLRRKHLSLQKIRKVLGELNGTEGMEQFVVDQGPPDVYLLTDGADVTLQRSPQAIVDVLMRSNSPMITLCISEHIRELGLPSSGSPRKPVHTERRKARGTARKKRAVAS